MDRWECVCEFLCQFVHVCVCVPVSQPYLDDPMFVPEEVVRASSAAEGLCKWVRAVVEFHHIAKMIEPKKAALKEASAALAAAEKVLTAKKEQLKAVMEHIQSMVQDLNRVRCVYM